MNILMGLGLRRRAIAGVRGRAAELDGAHGKTVEVVCPFSLSILGRLMKGGDGSMGRDVAEYLLSIDFDAGGTERMNALAERAREGNLTTEEAAELDSYLHVGSLVSILQSKARLLLKSEGSASTRPNSR